MPRLASLFLPDLAIDRIRRAERRIPSSFTPAPGRPEACRVLPARTGHWRPGARWARDAQPKNVVLHQAAGAIVTAHKLGNQNVLAAVSREARALGLAPGMSLAKARVLVSGLDVRPADHAGDTAWLTRLGVFAARRWSPRAALSGGDGLWLDLTGVAHLFGGEEKMCEHILAFVGRLGFRARIAVAGTAGAAHALTHYGGARLILCNEGDEAEALAPLPLAALRLEEEMLERAHRLGLDRVHDIIAMPRAPLQRRFGAMLPLRLDQALGRAAEPLDPIVPEDAPSVLLRFAEPIATAEAIGEASNEAVRRLMLSLTETGRGVRHLVLICERLDKEAQVVAIRTARATRDGDHLVRLIEARIETIEPGFGIERMRLVAWRMEPLGAHSIEGVLTGEKTSDLVLLVDRLATRLGAQRIHRLTARESDLPERSVARTGSLAETGSWPDWPRPTCLLHPPEPVEHVVAELPDGPPLRFRWRGKNYRVAAADGPERVYGEWWVREAERAEVRDYFQVEDEGGTRLWLFRKGDGESLKTGDMSWHVHGVFA